MVTMVRRCNCKIISHKSSSLLISISSIDRSLSWRGFTCIPRPPLQTLPSLVNVRLDLKANVYITLFETIECNWLFLPMISTAPRISQQIFGITLLLSMIMLPIVNRCIWTGFSTVRWRTVIPIKGRAETWRSDRPKSACEVLNDATWLVRSPFNLTFNDWAPNAMNATYNSQPNNGLAWVTGRVNSAMNFNSSSAHVESCGYYALGQSRSFSIALWVNPSYPGGTLFHLSSSSGGAGAWCLPMIGFSSNTSIVIQTFDPSVRFVTGPILPISSWTHIVFTWSATSGLSLYINWVSTLQR